MLQGARRRIDFLIGRRTGFAPPRWPEQEQPGALRAALDAWSGACRERYARVFLRGQAIFARRAEGKLFARLAACGVVERLGPAIYAPCVRLYPFYGRYVATDLLTHREPDQVFSLMFEQVYLVRNMDVRPGDRVLELCVGSGVNSLFAADVASQVTGVDVNARALAFAHFNERMSPGLVPLEVVHASLFEGLAAERQFDLLLVNPPFELVPRTASWFLHSDGGEDGLDVVRAMLLKTQAHLAPGGRMDMITWSPATPSGPLLLDLLREALPEMRLTVHLLDERPLDAHLVPFRTSKHHDAFRARLTERGIQTVQFLFVHAAPSTAPGVECVDAGAEIETCRALAHAWL